MSEFKKGKLNIGDSKKKVKSRKQAIAIALSKAGKAKKVNMAWFSVLKLGLNAATHIYKKKQETKMAMADAQHMHASKMARGESEYQGKLLEARQSDWKDEFVLIVLTLPILVIAWGVFSDDPGAAAKIKEFFEQFQQLPSWFTNLWILVVASIYGIKGTQIFKNGGKK